MMVFYLVSMIILIGTPSLIKLW